MRLPQVLVYETDGRLAALLRALADERKWLLREPRQLSACSRLFERGGPGVLVLRPSSDAERELTMLEQLTWLHPEVAVVLVCDSEQTYLSNLAWDLGVRWVLPMTQASESLAELVSCLMARYSAGTEK